MMLDAAMSAAIRRLTACMVEEMVRQGHWPWENEDMEATLRVRDWCNAQDQAAPPPLESSIPYRAPDAGALAAEMRWPGPGPAGSPSLAEELAAHAQDAHIEYDDEYTAW